MSRRLDDEFTAADLDGGCGMDINDDRNSLTVFAPP